MNLVALNIDTIPLGQPLPFALRGAQGVLLAHKGYVIRNRAELEVLRAFGVRVTADGLTGADVDLVDAAEQPLAPSAAEGLLLHCLLLAEIGQGF